MRVIAMGMLFAFAFSSCTGEGSDESAADTAKTGLSEKDDKETDGQNGEEDSRAEVSCELLTTQACKGNEDCAVVQGRPFNKKELCFEELADMACTDKGSGGGDVELVVKDANGDCWLFGGGAKLPDSFSEATSDPECPGTQQPLCQTLSCWTETVEGCLTRDECDLLSASKVDKERKCREKVEPVGCRPRSFKDAGCGDDAMFCAKSKEGDIWIFGNSCIVAEWEYIETEEGVHCVEMEAYEPCES